MNIISEKSAKRFHRFCKSSYALESVHVRLYFGAAEDRDPNEIVLASFKLCEKSLKRREKLFNGILKAPADGMGKVLLWTPESKPTFLEIERMQVILQAFLCGARSRELGFRKVAFE